MKTKDIKNIASAYMQVLEGKKMDKVDPKALEKDFDDRKDKDIDNDGDTDASDEYLHNRRKAVKKAMNKEEYGPGHIGAVQKMLDKEREAKKAKDAMKKEDTDMSESRWPILQRIMERQAHGNMDNGSPAGEGLSPSAKAELERKEGDSGIDGAKAAADTIANAVAQVKVAPKRPGDKADGDKAMPKNDGK